MTDQKVIILNGVSSVGKSSVAEALTTGCLQQFMHFKGDVFLEMLPPSMFGHPDGVVVARESDGKSTPIRIEIGPVMDRLMRGMQRAVAALVAEGNSLIVDDVMLGAADQRFYREVLTGYDVKFVGLFAPIEIVEQRERERGNRLIGLARWQFDRVHNGVQYDCEIDTSANDAQECATQIARTLNLFAS